MAKPDFNYYHSPRYGQIIKLPASEFTLSSPFLVINSSSIWSPVLGLWLRGSHPLRVRGGGRQQRLRRPGHLHDRGELQDGGYGVLQVHLCQHLILHLLHILRSDDRIFRDYWRSVTKNSIRVSWERNRRSIIKNLEPDWEFYRRHPHTQVASQSISKYPSLCYDGCKISPAPTFEIFLAL